MSTSNITSYVPNGFDVNATPRRTLSLGTPLNEGCSPTQGTDTHGPTAVINSVSNFQMIRLLLGQLLNMRFASGHLLGRKLNEICCFLTG